MVVIKGAMSTGPVFVFALASFILFYSHRIITVDCLGGDVAISCSSIRNSTPLDGLEWIGDAGAKIMSLPRSIGKSRSSTAVAKSFSADPVPNITSGISATGFHCTFQVNSGSGQKFIYQVHVYPASCRGLVEYGYCFPTKAGSITLAGDDSGVKYPGEPFNMSIDELRKLNITFYPSLNFHPTAMSSKIKTGKRYRSAANTSYLMQWDTCLSSYGDMRFDHAYAFSLPVPVTYLVLRYRSTQTSAAVLEAFLTSGDIGKAGRLDEMEAITFRIPARSGFGYSLKLNFCEIDVGMIESGRRLFSVLISDQVAQTLVSDHAVRLTGNKESGKCDILTAQQSAGNLVITLNGVPVFRMTLGNPHFVFLKRILRFWTLKMKTLVVSLGLGNGLFILLILLNVILYGLSQVWDKKFHGKKDIQSALTEQPCHNFSLAEILSATKNFSDASVIGKGGFGKVYKGFFPAVAANVAIKRLNPNSKQGAHEFWTEVKTLSKLRHVHLVSLIGYCNECGEMILVYEYMPHGTLADNLLKIGRDRTDFVPFCWEERLKICIGAARGLDYLHTGTQYGVIHRDVKDSNILLDENFVAKISDFGLSKLGKITESRSYISTKVKGTFGYLDPDYFMTHKLTRKSDVYAFGVVLLVVLCGRSPVDNRVPEARQSLLFCFQKCIRKGEIDEIVDPCLKGKIPSDSLSIFVKSIESCLQHQPKRRPTMAQVVARLEDALELRHTPILSSVLKKSFFVNQPWEARTSQSFEHNQDDMHAAPEENVVSLPMKRTTIQRIRNSNLSIRGPDFPHREKGCTSAQKPSLLQHSKTLFNGGKPKENRYSLISVDGPCFVLSIDDIQAATDRCSEGRVILQDELRKVYVGFVPRMQREVYIFSFKTKVDYWEVLAFQSEIEKLSKLRHPNLLSLTGYCYHENQLFITYEYIGNSNLHKYLYGTVKKDGLSWKQRLQICIGVAQGLHYLHRNCILHMDLRPAIILLDNNCVPRISNFGLSKVGPKSLFSVSNTANRVPLPQIFEYMSPEETIPGWKSTEKSDVYSFGLVLLEVLCCQRPLKCNANLKHDEKHLEYCVKRSIRHKTLARIIDSRLKGKFAKASLAEFLKIAFSCLQPPAALRPHMADVVENLKFAIELQAIAEAAEQDVKGKGKQYIKRKGNSAFRLENIYPEISHLAD